MPILTSRAQADGGAISIIIPTDVARRLGVAPGDELFWVEDGSGGYRVTVSNPQRAALLSAHAEIMEEHAEVFRKLAE